MSANDTDNAVLLPILSAVLAKECEEKTIVSIRPRRTTSFNWSCLWWPAALVAIVIVICISNSSDSNKSTSTPGSLKQPPAPKLPAFNPRKAEMDRESQMIEGEKAEADRLEGEIKTLNEDIARRRATLDRTNELAVDEFNRKVDDYNRLLEQLRAKERRVNQMVESYNEKLRQLRR
jgi:septal ring factor EnvC (AmiA/AmiB activator)